MASPNDLTEFGILVLAGMDRRMLAYNAYIVNKLDTHRPEGGGDFVQMRPVGSVQTDHSSDELRAMTMRLPKNIRGVVDELRERALVQKPANDAAPTRQGDLVLADTDDDMSEAELARLNEVLERGFEAIKAGRFRPAREVVADLRHRFR